MSQPVPTPDDEWREFRALILDAMARVKAARDKLKHQRNISRAQGFAAAVNRAYQDWS